jgi:Phosphomannomutase
MIKFGTDGYRAIIGKDFTFEVVSKIAQAHADSLKERNGKK